MSKEKFVRKKPHVNIGTIGHIDHGKTTLTAAITKVMSDTYGGSAISYADIAKGGTVRDDTKIVTIAVSHVEYESDDAALRARRLPRPRRLHQEHDHRRGADGRRDPGGERAGRPDAADQGARAPGASGRRAGDRVALNKTDAVDDPDLLELVEIEVRELLNKYDFKGDDAKVVRVSALKALQGDAKWIQSIKELVDGGRRADSAAGSRRGQAVPDGDRGRVLDQGPRHGGDGPHRARQDPRERRGRDPRVQRPEEVGRDGRGDVPQAARRGAGWRQRRLPAARHREGPGRARPGAVQARLA